MGQGEASRLEGHRRANWEDLRTGCGDSSRGVGQCLCVHVGCSILHGLECSWETGPGANSELGLGSEGSAVGSTLPTLENRRSTDRTLCVPSTPSPPSPPPAALAISQAQDIKKPGMGRSSQGPFIPPCPHGPPVHLCRQHSPWWEPVTVKPGPASSHTTGDGRQAANEACSGTPLIGCQTLIPTTHLALVINWGFLPDLRHDWIPPRTRFSQLGSSSWSCLYTQASPD